MRLSPADLESLLREHLVPRDPSFQLELNPEPNAVFEDEDGSLRARLRIVCFDDDGVILDFKEQECFLVPSHVRDAPARVAMVVRQWARALSVLVAAHGGEVETLLPYDLTDLSVLNDASLTLESDFEAFFQDLERQRARVAQAVRGGVVEALSTWGLQDRTDEFLSLVRPAIWFGDHERVDDDERDPLPVGVTRFGGEPDLPPEIAWPTHNGRPLTFAAQLDLDAFRAFPAAHELPNTGLLSFFYEFDENEPRAISRVMHIASKENLERRPTPAAGDKRPAFMVTPRSLAETMPQTDSPFYRSLLPDAAVRAYYQSIERATHGPAHVKDPLEGLDRYLACWEGYDPVTDQHRLLGYAQVYQNDPYVSTETHVTRGTWDHPNLGSSEGIALSHRARRWRSLLQIWAMIDGELLLNQDCGALYFMIPDDALASHDWTRVWCEMQCS